MEGLYVWDENGVKYRKVKRKANVGEKILITDSCQPLDYEDGDVLTVTSLYYVCGHGGVDVKEAAGRIRHKEYVVLEPIEEPSPQLAGIHDGLAKLALEITELKRKVDANTNDIAFLDEKRLAFENDAQLTPLQLAILNAKDTPAETKLALIVEAGRLESERQAVINDR